MIDSTGGLTRDEINKKINVLIFGIDQLEIKLRRKIADEAGNYQVQYKAPLLRSVQRLLSLEQNTSLFELLPVKEGTSPRTEIETGEKHSSGISGESGSPDLFCKPHSVLN